MRTLFWYLLFALLVVLGVPFYQHKGWFGLAYGLLLILAVRIVIAYRKSKTVTQRRLDFRKAEELGDAANLPEHFSPTFKIRGSGKFKTSVKNVFEFGPTYWELQRELRCEFYENIPIVVKLAIQPKDHRNSTPILVMLPGSSKLLGRLGGEQNQGLYKFLEANHGSALCDANVIFGTNELANVLKLDIKYPIKYSWRKHEIRSQPFVSCVKSSTPRKLH